MVDLGTADARVQGSVSCVDGRARHCQGYWIIYHTHTHRHTYICLDVIAGFIITIISVTQDVERLGSRERKRERERE